MLKKPQLGAVLGIQRFGLNVKDIDLNSAWGDMRVSFPV